MIERTSRSGDRPVIAGSSAASAGRKSLQLPVFPAELGLSDYWDSRYDQLWRAISAAGLPICCTSG